MSSIIFPLLKGKTALITGGTTGIGRGIALEYLRQGCNVAVNHLGRPGDEPHKASILQQAREIREQSQEAGEMVDVVGNIAEPEATEKLVKDTVARFGQVDVLVANAGIFEPAPFLEYV